MTTEGVQSLLCHEELEDKLTEEPIGLVVEGFSADLVYYYSLLAPNMSPPVLPRSELRMDVVDWILKVSSKNLISRETAHVAIFIFDKALSESKDHRSCSLLLLAMTSLMLSSKFLEKKPILIKALNEYSDYQFSQNDIIKTELKCLNACNFKIPSTTFARWLDFLTEKWDQFVKAMFLVPNLEDFGWENNQTYLILFRQQEEKAHRRFQKVFSICDMICLSNQFYVFDHRMLAFAVLWKMVYHEFVEDNMKFYQNYGFPGVSALFGLCDQENNKNANDWIFELLMRFSSIYIGEASTELAELFEFVESYLQVPPANGVVYEKYLKTTDPEERSYEHFLGLQVYSSNYLKIAKCLN